MMELLIVIIGLSIPIVMTLIDIISICKEYKKDKEKGDDKQ